MMTARKFFLYIVLPAAAFTAAGCSMDSHYGQPDGSGITVRLATAGPDNSPDDVRGLVFSDGRLTETVEAEPAGGENTYRFDISGRSGIMYILSGTSSIEGLGGIIAGKSTFEDLASVTGTAEDMTSCGTAMTGSLDLEKAGDVNTVSMTRSVARLDIAPAEDGVRIHGIRISGIAESGYLLPRTSGMAYPDDVPLTEYSKDYGESPLENDAETLLYLVEQSGESASAEISAGFGGAMHTFSVRLPKAISRNTVYTIKVYGNGASLSVPVNGDGWEEGESAGSSPVPAGKVDTDNSVIPDGVRVNDGGDTVYVSHLKTAFTLALLAEPGSKVVTDGSSDLVRIEQVPQGKSGLEKVAAVSVSSGMRMPGVSEDRINLDIVTDGTATGRVVLVFMRNPVEIGGHIRLDADGTCDFGKYIDGELGTFRIPADKMLSLEFGEEESPWIKAVETSEANPEPGTRVYRILGGWKPNDPLADGREQTGTIVISDKEGSGRESYTVKRRNLGLPVVKMGDTWWAKYNLRGNVKDFSDQITPDRDPAAHDRLADLLLSVPDTELYGLMGDQYQGGYLEGLELSYDGSSFYYDGMKSSGQNFGTMDPGTMAPDGYMIPDYNDFAFFSASDNYNIGGTGTRSFTNMAGEEISVTVSERTVSFLGQEYGTIAVYDFSHEGNHWVLYGPGHQWNTTPGNIARMNILLATYGDSGRSWCMEGYAEADRPGQNWMKFTSQNQTKTRTIRCIKSPVEYIYE